jgi:WD40 repeat protein
MRINFNSPDFSCPYNYKYQVGGSLPPDAPTYVKRQADEDFYQSLKSGKFCYVLSSRQMGKSSLQLRTMRRLEAQGIACAAIDLSEIGNWNVNQSQWYAGIVYSLVNSFNLFEQFDLRSWWREHEFLSPLQRFSEFIERVLLVEITQDTVIFVDEIDSVLSLNFPIDDFFIFIRSCFNKRADKPAYKRLTFALLGVATPSDLIKDKSRTPFNIGQAIHLRGFQLDEIQPLAVGLAAKVSHPETVLLEILSWTGGQPFLTQKLCHLVANGDGELGIEELVRSHIIENWESNDEPKHLRTIIERIFRSERNTSRLLGLYQQILQQGEITVDHSLEQTELQLTGLVIKEQNKLVIANRIYERIFNQDWVENALVNLRPYAEALNAWVASDCEDESRLLRGRALQDALEWGTGKKLSDRDYQFLTASQELERKEVQKALEAEREANQILATAQQKANQTIKRGLAALAAISAVAATLVLNAGTTIKQAREGSKLEWEGISALRQYESEEKEIESLLLAMQAGQDLKSLSNNQALLQEYPAISPIYSLQTILDKIHQRHQFKGHQGVVWRVSYSPDGKYIASADDDGIVKIWQRTGLNIANLKGHRGEVFDVSFSPDGKQIATAGGDGTVRLWNKQGKQLFSMPSHAGKVWSVSFSPDGKAIASAGEDGIIRIWNHFGKLINQFNSEQNQIWSIRFNSNQQLATVGQDGTVRLWNQSGKLLHKLTSNTSKIRNLSFSPKGDYIATGEEDGTIRLWQQQGKQIAQINSYQGKVTSIKFSPNGKQLATGGADGTVRIWDFSGKQLAKSYSHQGQILSLSFSPDGKEIASGGDDGIVRIWQFWQRGISRSVLQGGQMPKNESEELWRVSFSNDGKQIATAGVDGKVKLWDWTGKQLAQFKSNQSRVLSLSFSPDRQKIVTAGADGKVEIWHRQGFRLAEFKSDQGRVWSVSFSPDGDVIATAGDNGTVRFWNLFGEPLTQFNSHQNQVWSVSFSPDGQVIATAGDDGTIRLWNRSGKLLEQFNSHQGEVRSLSFSPDGQRLATAGADGTVKLWFISGKPPRQLLANFKVYDPGEVLAVSFSSDGKRLAAAGSDISKIRWWRVEGLDELLQRGCVWLKDYLVTHQEARKQLTVCQSSGN